MELRYLLELMSAHRRFIAVTSLLAALLGLAATYVLSEDFEAQVSILIRPRKEVGFDPSGKEMLDYPVSLSIPAESISQTYSSIMTSDAVAMGVVDRLKLDQLVPPERPWYSQAYHWTKDKAKGVVLGAWMILQYGRIEHKTPYLRAVQDVRDALEATPVQNTYLFALTATWSEPDTAAKIADTAAEVFIDYIEKTRQSEDGTSVGFMSQRLGSLRDELGRARVELAEFRERAFAASLDDQIAVKLETLAEFEKARDEARKQLRETTADLGATEAQLASEAPEIHTRSTRTRNPVVAELETRIATDEVTLAGLRETHTDAHPEVKALVARIEAARGRIADAEAQVANEDTTELNQAYTQLRQRALGERSTTEAIRARVRALDDTVVQYEGEVRGLASQKDELSRLTLEVEVLESEFRLVSKEYAEARLEAAQQIREIRSLGPAIPPAYPVGPIKILYAGTAMALGFLSALCLVLVLDWVDPRIRNGEDLERVLERPVLATVPLTDAGRVLGILEI